MIRAFRSLILVVFSISLGVLYPAPSEAELNKSEKETVVSVQKNLERADARGKAVCKHYSKDRYCRSSQAMRLYLASEVSSQQAWFASSGIGITQAMKDRGGYEDWRAHVLPLVASYNKLLSNTWLRADFSDKASKQQVNTYQKEMGQRVVPEMMTEFADELVADFIAEQEQPSGDIDKTFNNWADKKFATSGVKVPELFSAKLRATTASSAASVAPSKEASEALRTAARLAESKARTQSGCLRFASACRDGETPASMLQTLEQDFQSVTQPRFQGVLEYAQRSLDATSGEEAKVRNWLREVAPAVKDDAKALAQIRDALPEGALKSEYQRVVSDFRDNQFVDFADIYAPLIIADFQASDKFVKIVPMRISDELRRAVTKPLCDCEISFKPGSVVAAAIERAVNEHAVVNSVYRKELSARLDADMKAAEQRRKVAEAERERLEAIERAKAEEDARKRAAWKASGKKTPVGFFGIRFNETSKAEATRIFDEVIGNISIGRLTNPSGRIGQFTTPSRTGKLELTCWRYYSYGPAIKESCLYFLAGVAVGGRFNMDPGECSDCNHPSLPDLAGLDFLKSQGFESTESYGPKELGFNATSVSYELNEMSMNWSRHILMTDKVSVVNTLLNFVTANICIYPTEFESEFATQGEQCMFRP